MAKHRITEDTPKKYLAKNVIRRVLERIGPSNNKHSKEIEWRRKLFHATYTDLGLAEPTRHQKFNELNPTSFYGLVTFVNRS
jgi:hypothetical protein